MSVNIARTADGWWVERDGRLLSIDTRASTTRELLADREAIDRAVESGSAGPRANDVVLVSPVTAPARVVAQMVNYRSHAIDSGFDPDAVPPTFFRKASGSVTGPTDDIVCPPHVGFLDYEVELGVVLGRRLEIGDVVTSENLGDYVAGLVITNDVSARDIQLTRTQFYESKSYPTFTPVGPYLALVSADELAELQALRLTLTVNGEVRQSSTVAEMIVTPAEALTLLARFQVLDPGDLVLTGTPGGTALKAPPKVVEKIAGLLPPAVKWRAFFSRQASNPRYLHNGDVVTATIGRADGAVALGTQVNTVRSGGLR